MRRLAPKHLVGRFGLPRLGTLNESPLTMADVEVLAEHVRTSTIQLGQMSLLRIFDRQVLRGRSAHASRANAMDALFLKWKPLECLSCQQVLVFNRGG